MFKIRHVEVVPTRVVKYSMCIDDADPLITSRKFGEF